MEVQQCTPLLAELDDYMQETIFHMLGSCNVSQRQQNRSKSLVQHLHRRLSELEYKCAKSKARILLLLCKHFLCLFEEACLNAQALKRQVAESQKLAEQCKILSQECARLENECALYNNDREVFQEAADEAEDRAALAEQRAILAEQRVHALLLELESLKRSSAEEEDCNAQQEALVGDLIIGLRSRLADIEAENQSLQNKLMEVEAEAKCYKNSIAELQEMQSASEMMEALWKDEQTVHSTVSSAIMAGIIRALEEERDDIVNVISFNWQQGTDHKQSKAELQAYQEWMKVAEIREQALLLEAQALRQELAGCKNNLEKAEDEVHLLADENKELRWMLRFRSSSCSDHISSPLPGKGVRINAMAQNPMERLFTNGMDKRRQQQQQQGNPSLPCEATHQCAAYTIDNILLSVVQWCSQRHSLHHFLLHTRD
ncbi:unnamed protein product [Sphagnum compactum]